MNKIPPVTNRPPFGEVVILRKEPVRLVAYLNNTSWYWIPYTHHSVPPKREFIPYNMLRKYAQDI